MTTLTTSVRLPCGELTLLDEPAIRVRLPVGRQGKTELRQALRRFSSLPPRVFLLPSLVKDLGKELEVTFMPEHDALRSATDVLAAPPEEAAVKLPLLLSAVRALVDSLNHWPAEMALLPPSPALLFALPGQERPWRIVPIPGGDVRLGHWAEADAINWACLPPAAVWGEFDPRDAFLPAALLHYFLAGDLVPASLPAWSRFRRLLAGRAQPSRALDLAIQTVLPHTFETEATKLRELLVDALQPAAQRRPNWEEAQEPFREIDEMLSLQRLMNRWKYEQRSELAKQMDKTYAKFFAVANPTAPPQSIPVETSDLPGPLDEQLKAIPEDGISAVRKYLGLVQRMAARGAEQIPVVKKALDQLNDLDQIYLEGSIFDESARLQMAHIQGRWLGVDEARLVILRQQLEGSWNSAAACAIRARLLSGSDGYSRISQICKRGRKLIEAMPQHGGPAGTYLTSYLCLLDGIAHIGGAAKYGNVGFYADAFEQLRRAWELADGASDVALAETAIDWIAQLTKSTRLLAGTKWHIVHIGVDAFLTTQGLSGELLSKRGSPDIPWYDERWLFPA